MRDFPKGDVDVADMMRAREARAARQRALLNGHTALVCLTMNIPGPKKVSDLILSAFLEGERLIERALPKWAAFEEIFEKTGFEAYYALDGDAEAVKRALCAIEESAPLGRLYDIDVLDAAGEKVSREALGLEQRKCFLCGQPAFLCARSRAHTVTEMVSKIEGDIRRFLCTQASDALSDAAVDALILEANTTPKPGLVDQNNCGSHPDMTLDLLFSSARSLRGYFSFCAQTGLDADAPEDVFPALQTAGAEAEREMLLVTGGVNTHKGAIFSLGILCAAAGLCAAKGEMCPERVCETAGRIARRAMDAHFAKLNEANARSFGERLFLSSGLRGIRGEAADGFPSLLAVWPAFYSEAARLSKAQAGVRALIRLLSAVQDTTLIKRGGMEARAKIAGEAHRIAENGFQTDEIRALDERMIRQNLTCGGCADLLACLYFLDRLTALPERSVKSRP